MSVYHATFKQNLFTCLGTITMQQMDRGIVNLLTGFNITYTNAPKTRWIPKNMFP